MRLNIAWVWYNNETQLLSLTSCWCVAQCDKTRGVARAITGKPDWELRYHIVHVRLSRGYIAYPGNTASDLFPAILHRDPELNQNTSPSGFPRINPSIHRENERQSGAK